MEQKIEELNTTRLGGSKEYTMANSSLYRHTPNWFPTPLALQDTGTLRTTWRYSDLILVAVVYPQSIFATKKREHCKNVSMENVYSRTICSILYRRNTNKSCQRRIIKYDFACITICKVQREVLKIVGQALGFQRSPRHHANVNGWQNHI